VLEIDEDQPFQEKVWIIQRCGWGLLLLFLVAAAAGLTGPSPLTRVVEEKGGHRMEYPRFGRIGTNAEMIVSPATGRTVFFSREILRKAEIKTVMPFPAEGQARPDGMSFEFGHSGRGEIHLGWKPREAGWIRGKVRVGEPAVEFEFKQFVYF